MSEKCGFDEAWVARCTNEIPCTKHGNLVCVSCGAKATKSCEVTGMLVCGEPLCDDCEHTLGSTGHAAGMFFGKDNFTVPEHLKSHCRKDRQVYKTWYAQEVERRKTRERLFPKVPTSYKQAESCASCLYAVEPFLTGNGLYCTRLDHTPVPVDVRQSTYKQRVAEHTASLTDDEKLSESTRLALERIQLEISNEYYQRLLDWGAGRQVESDGCCAAFERKAQGDNLCQS